MSGNAKKMESKKSYGLVGLEVFSEMTNGVCKDIYSSVRRNCSPKVISKMTRNFCKNCKGFSEGFFGPNVAPYMLPTYFRVRNDLKKNKSGTSDVLLSKSQKIGYCAGLVGFAVQTGLYAYNFSEHPEYLLLPVLINAENYVCERY